MSRWYDDKNKVKDVFDCIRNYVLCGVVCFTGVYTLTIHTEIPFMRYLNIFAGIVFILISLYLFHVNTCNLNNNILNLISQNGKRFWLGNLISFLAVFLGFNLLSHNASQIKVNGKTLGNTVVFSPDKASSETAPKKQINQDK